MRIHRHRQRKPKYQIPNFKVNDKITAEKVRLVYDGGAEVMSTSKALQIAREAGQDLIEVSPKAEPPVCKIMEFGNFKYQKEKEMKKQRAASKEVEVKGIRLSFRIGSNDLQVRRNQAKKFLEKGHKLKIEMQLRGREREHRERAKEIFDNFIALLKEDYDIKVESGLKFQSGRLNMIVGRNS